jgi:indole-3-glycerol phosphate synthase
MKPTILQEIFEAKKLRVGKRRQEVDLSELKDICFKIREKSEKHCLIRALSSAGINVIAEIKRASPSKGVINDSIDVAEVARAYERGGARAISVLTEEDYFKGSLGDLRTVRDSVSLPILQKDFIFDGFQIYEAAAAGADAILLIVAMLGDNELKHLYRVATDLRMDALVEVHDAGEMERAAALGADLIGVNNRNLHTFEVSLDISRGLIESSPDEALLVAESGLKTRDDLLEFNTMGFDGFLIGETLMRAGDPEAELGRLVAV